MTIPNRKGKKQLDICVKNDFTYLFSDARNQNKSQHLRDFVFALNLSIFQVNDAYQMYDNRI